MDQYQCKRCNQSIALSEKAEHDDWHFAQDLADEDGTRDSVPTPSNTITLSTASTQKNTTQTQYAPPNYAPPPYPAKNTPSAMPSRPTNAQTIRRYVNVVDRAAEWRARDEVRIIPKCLFLYRC